MGKKVEGTEINLCMLILLPPRHKSEDAETQASVRVTEIDAERKIGLSRKGKMHVREN